MDESISIHKSSHAIGYLLKQWLRQSYDELGTIILLNFFLVIVILVGFAPATLSGAFLPEKILRTLPFGFMQGLFLFVGAWLTCTAWLALNHHLEQILTFQYPSWMVFWRSIPKFLLSSLWTILFLGFGFGILIFDIYMFPQMFAGTPYLGLIAVTLSFWLGLFLGMIQVHLVPFLVHQERPFWTGLKRATLVIIWKPIRTLVILIAEIFFIYLCLRIPPAILLVPGIFALLSVLSLLILLDEWRDPYEKTPEALRAGR